MKTHRLYTNPLSAFTAVAVITTALSLPTQAALLIDFDTLLGSSGTSTGYGSAADIDEIDFTAQTYSFGDAGYSGTQMDTGSGVTLNILTSSSQRWIDRETGGGTALQEDWVGSHGLNSTLDLVFSGLSSGGS